MSDQNETVADVLREMRSLTESCGTKRRVNLPTITVRSWNGLLDRIEAAVKREREALDAARKVAKDTAEQYRKLYEKKKEADNQLVELEERYPLILEQSNAAALR